MNKTTLKKSLLILGSIVTVSLILSSCSQQPKLAQPIKNFDLNKYLGKWYEIARIDFKHEKDLDNVTAEYSLKEDNTVKVLNKGYNFIKNEWETAEGKATFRKEKNEAALKVSFFGPFYSGYNVLAIDDAYKYALVAGKNTDYLWILSREKQIPESIKAQYLKLAQSVGYDTNRLNWIKHDRH